MPARPDTRPEWQCLADDPDHPFRQLERHGGPFLEPVDPAVAAAQPIRRWHHSAEAWTALAVAALSAAVLVVVLVLQPWRHLADEIAGVPYNVGRLLDPDTWGER